VLRELTSLLRLGGGTDDERIRRALALLVEQLDMRTAIVSRFDDGRRIITHVAGDEVPADGMLPIGAEETLCHLVADGTVGPLVPDTRADALIGRHGHVEAYSIGAWVGVPLRVAGEVVGTLCAMAPQARPDLTDRDTALLVTVGDYVGEVLAQGRASTATAGDRPEVRAEVRPEIRPEVRPAGVPAPRAAVDLPEAAAALSRGEDLETLTRPVLELVHEITGLDSAYLTLIDWEGEEQQIRYSLNTAEMTIPEGLRVPWAGTLCRRSLHEGRPYTRDVPLVWGDSEAARDLEIQTYVSVPVRDADDMVVGTLCATSKDAVELDDRALHSMRMFAQLLSAQIQRETVRGAAAERAEERDSATAGAARDRVTGLFTRAGVGAWLRSVVPGLRPDVEQLALAWVDVVPLPGAPAPPEGWQARFAEAVRAAGRAGDLHGRVGESFVVASVLPLSAAALGSWRDRLAHAVHEAAGHVLRTTIGVAAARDPQSDPEALLQRASASARGEA
jgi:GAF domain-containing protein